MVGKKGLAYEEFIALAKENYTKSGDVAVECQERYQFDDYVKMFGSITKVKALQMFRQWRSEEKEQEVTKFSEIWQNKKATVTALAVWNTKSHMARTSGAKKPYNIDSCHTKSLTMPGGSNPAGFFCADIYFGKISFQPCMVRRECHPESFFAWNGYLQNMHEERRTSPIL